jgi:hypothetical protein
MMQDQIGVVAYQVKSLGIAGQSILAEQHTLVVARYSSPSGRPRLHDASAAGGTAHTTVELSSNS